MYLILQKYNLKPLSEVTSQLNLTGLQVNFTFLSFKRLFRLLYGIRLVFDSIDEVKKQGYKPENQKHYDDYHVDIFAYP